MFDDVLDGAEVQQPSDKIPPVFNSEQLMMYGMLRSKKKSGIHGCCKVTLSGKLLGGAIIVGNRGEIVPAI